VCGICGVFSADGVSPADHNAVGAMLAAMVHRGPDNGGVFQASCLSMGMRRLSIIDQSGGDQPLYNEDRSLALIANGEIYNFIELRQSLEQRGHRFSTRSDCETILHLYEEKGADCLYELRGMFAFALWDEKKKTLLLARDRLGEKPLYLHRSGASLWFASELGVLAASGRVRGTVDPVSVHRYLHHQFVPEPSTPIRGVGKLPPAHFMMVTAGRGGALQQSIQRYWSLADVPPVSSDPVVELTETFREISHLIVRSDVPVGIALSGGIDSSAVAALSARHTDTPLHAFCVGYVGSPENDERAQVREFTTQIGLPFHEIELSTDDFVRDFDEMSAWLDEPVADIAGYAYYRVMKQAHESDIRVMLTGLGGDELFWGYPEMHQILAANRKKLTLGSVGRVRGKFERAVTSHPFYHRLRHSTHLPGALRKQMDTCFDLALLRRDYPDELVYELMHGVFRRARVPAKGLYTDAFADQLADDCELITSGYSLHAGCGLPLELNRYLIETWLQSNCLSLSDRLSMRCSVEARLPLLDYKLVELAMAICRDLPVDPNPKAMFKECLKPLVSEELLSRKKRGFEPPWHDWTTALCKARGDELAEGELCRDGILRRSAVENILATFRRTGEPTMFLYELLLLQAWYRSVACKFISR